MGRLTSNAKARIAVRTRLRRLLVARRPARLGTDDEALLGRVIDGIGNYHRLVCGSTPGAHLLERHGVMAAVMPATPEHSSLNAVVYEETNALAAALDEIAATYDEAGVKSWMVWVPVGDREASKLLKRAGYQLNPNFTAMGRELQRFERPVNTLEEWTSAGDPAALAAIADPAGSVLGPPFMRAFSNLPHAEARVYLASLDRRPVSCFLTSDKDGNCAVDVVATRPEARGRGLASALLGQALADAAERGCVTTTLVSSLEAKSLYKGVGYRALCPLLRWERLPR